MTFNNPIDHIFPSQPGTKPYNFGHKCLFAIIHTLIKALVAQLSVHPCELKPVGKAGQTSC